MKTKRILIGGSPCTKWSIAQSKDRETTASGIGWELFCNFLIAREKFEPHYFLYENNKSAAEPIKRQIAKELGVWDGTMLMPYNDNRFTYINSALVSAQNRERFYVTGGMGDISQPEDMGILLRDVLDNGAMYMSEKAYTLRASGGNKQGISNVIRHITSGGQFGYQGALEPVQIGEVEDGGTYRNGKQASQQSRVYSPYGKSVYIDTDGRKFIAEPINTTDDGKARTIKAQYQNTGPANLLKGSANFSASGVAECVPDGLSIDGKKIYQVLNGLITINGEQHPIKLPDGFYIIRKLTVAECRRLQTIPDWYVFPVSNTQAYRMLGNGWTVEVIKHILRHIPEIKNGEDYEFEVLSMYDGMACGAIALTELGAKIKRYVAYEIDKWAIAAACANFPFIEQRGDAFAVRDTAWAYGTDLAAGMISDAAAWKF